MFRAALLLIVAATLQARQEVLRGRVTDGQRPLPGVRVGLDWPRQVHPRSDHAVVETDAEGTFALPVPPGAPRRLVLEKSGWSRDIIPEAGWKDAFRMSPALQHRREKVFVVRLEVPGAPDEVPDSELRRLFFSGAWGVASAANYFREISKGALELEEGRWMRLRYPKPLGPEPDEETHDIAQWVLGQLKDLSLGNLDQVNNATGAVGPDGCPDHLWVILPGPPRSVTTRVEHLKPISLLEPLPWRKAVRWPVVLFPDQVVLGNVVHEAMHAMGEHRVDDFYLGCEDPLTAGIWDVMDVGMYRGWDRHHPLEGPWTEDTAYSPSQPMGWTRASLWYRGAFQATVPTLEVKGRTWEGWIDPLERAPGPHPQRVLVPDPRRKGRFWEFNVRRPWGFDAGTVAGRTGPGREGLVVARVDPSRLSPDDPRGPVRVIDAHPGTQEPTQPRFPCDRFELDDAAYNLGGDEIDAGEDGPLAWGLVAQDGEGRLKVRLRLKASNARRVARTR
ncbi:MAG TPA: carboxypeptidase-like regulatory domain-containing protein [Holophagaceae bacterium]|nr:carboxypeptidase-like regulatory domain-containing protein [Holophagaceae bacterium]